MAIDVSSDLEICRPRSDVAAFVCDPANDLKWIRALTEAQQLTAGPIAEGSHVRRVARMMGRSMPYTTEVIALREGDLLEMRTVEGPIAMLVTYMFSSTPEGTRVTVRNRGGSGILFALAGPLIGWLVNKRVRGDLDQLKLVVESGAPRGS